MFSEDMFADEFSTPTGGHKLIQNQVKQYLIEFSILTGGYLVYTEQGRLVIDLLMDGLFD